MRRQISLVHPRALNQRLAWVFAASALALTLALGGCRSGAHNGASTNQQTQSGPSTGATTGSATGASTSSTPSNSAALQQLQTIDNQNQSDAQQLSADQTSAGVNYTSQQAQAQP
jgi:hypothetical protein